jgi:hypothetical protein
MTPAVAALDSFGFYKEGVYFEKDCSNWELDHQVMLYGYGTSDKGNGEGLRVRVRVEVQHNTYDTIYQGYKHQGSLLKGS